MSCLTYSATMSQGASQAGSSNKEPSRASLQNSKLRRGQKTSSFQKALQDLGVRITYIGMACNLAMALTKAMGGWYLNSMILAADGWHSMTDLITDALTLVTISTKHNRIKQMGSICLAVILMSGGVHMGWESLQALQLDFYPAAAPTMEDTALHRPLPSVHAAWIASATIMVKEWLYYETMRVAKIRNSAALASNAIHHRMDSWTGLFTLLAIVASIGVENSKWIDSLGGLVTSGMVLYTGLNSARQSFMSFGKKAKKH